MKNIVIFGSGGHAKVILDEILDFKSKYKFLGFVDNSKKTGSNIIKINKKKFKIIDIRNIKVKKLYGVIGIGDNYLRFKNYELLKNQFKSIKWETIISKKIYYQTKCQYWFWVSNFSKFICWQWKYNKRTLHNKFLNLY